MSAPNFFFQCFIVVSATCLVVVLIVYFLSKDE